MAEVMSAELGQQILMAIQGLGIRMDKLEARMDKMEARMDRQERWMERLGGEFVGFRDEVRGDLRQWRSELREDLTRVKARIDVTAETVVLMASVMRGPKAFSDDLEGHLRQLSTQ